MSLVTHHWLIDGENQGFTFCQATPMGESDGVGSMLHRLFGFLCCAEFLTPDNTYFNPKVHLSISDLEYVHSDTQPYISLQIKA